MKTAFRIYNVLRPAGWLYGLITSLRNRMYDHGMLKSVSFPIPVICIGNITVGGTGKTPHTEYIATLLKDRMRIAILSRGYGRHTKGFILSDAQSDSSLIGDEPLQVKRRFPDVAVAVCEDRVTGIKRLTELCAPQVIILDDAYQHRKVTPSLNILLVNYSRNILQDAMLPAGRLRESANCRRRAQMIVVTKCPKDLSSHEMDDLASTLAVSPEQKVFFTTLDYGSLYPLDGKSAVPSQDCPVLALTGIADPAPMEAQLRKSHKEVGMLSYPDHHDFSRNDIIEIVHSLQKMPQGSIIVTTAKDAARLSGMDLNEDLKSRIFILPVRPAFLRDAKGFDDTILNHIETFKQS